jgi:hypothetical protein
MVCRKICDGRAAPHVTRTLPPQTPGGGKLKMSASHKEARSLASEAVLPALPLTGRYGV